MTADTNYCMFVWQIYRSDIDPLWYCPYLWYKFTEPSPAGDVDFFVIDTEAIRDGLNNYTGRYHLANQNIEHGMQHKITCT